MNSKIIVYSGLLLFAFFLMVAPAQAQRRSYVWTDEYDLLPRNEAALEYSTLFDTPDSGRFTGNTSVRQQLELRVGMSADLNVRVSQFFSQEPGDSFNYDGFMLQLRRRIGDEGDLPLNIVALADYCDRQDFSHHRFHVGAIFSKDSGDFNITVTPQLEVEENALGDGYDMRGRYAAGVSYLLNRLVSVGIETSGSEFGHYVGPTIAHGGQRFWFAAGTGLKIGNVDPGYPEFQGKFILGMKF